MTEITANLNYTRLSPRKTRLVADTIRGRHVQFALNALGVMRQRPARHLLKLLRSAVANAKHNHSIEAEQLRVKTITVDGGPMIKRWMPRAHGRATPIRERTAHVSLVLVNMPRKEKTTTKK